MSSPRRILLFTCGWMITAADEDAIRQVPADAWKPGIGQDGAIEEDKHAAEITDLMNQAGNWSDGLRWIARRVKPSRRQMRNLTDYEKKTGWRYSITCTNIPDTGIRGVGLAATIPSTSTSVHREHAVVETDGVRTAKAMGLRNLPLVIFSSAIMNPPDLQVCVMDSVVHGVPAGSANASAVFFLRRVSRARRGRREDRRSALFAERVLKRVAQLPVLGFQDADAGGGCFEAAQQRCGCRPLPLGDLRGCRGLLLPCSEALDLPAQVVFLGCKARNGSTRRRRRRC